MTRLLKYSSVTFTPSMLWIFAGAPFVEGLRRNVALTSALAAITAMAPEAFLAGLRQALGGAKRVAMEISTNDAVPAMDLVPLGVGELVVERHVPRGADHEVAAGVGVLVHDDVGSRAAVDDEPSGVVCLL